MPLMELESVIERTFVQCDAVDMEAITVSLGQGSSEAHGQERMRGDLLEKIRPTLASVLSSW